MPSEYHKQHKKAIRKDRRQVFLTGENRKQFEQRNRIIRARYDKGESMASIGRSFGMSRQRVYQIINGWGL